MQTKEFDRWRKQQPFRTSQIVVSTEVQFWLIQIEEGETPERIAGLQEAFGRFETAMSA